MEDTTKQKIVNACENSLEVTIPQPDFFSNSADIMHSYEVKDNGNVIQNLYKVINMRCDGFGCVYPTMELESSYLLGNCNDSSFCSSL